MKSTHWLRRAVALAIGVMTSASFMPSPEARAQEPQGGHFVVSVEQTFGINARLQGISKVLDEQLQLKGEGALVLSVGEGGPADKAGLKTNDIVLSVGDQPIKGLPELLAAVNRSNGKEITLNVLRGGKPLALSITPIPAAKAGKPHFDFHSNFTPQPRLEEIEIELQNLEQKIREKLQAAGVDVRLQLIKPGTLTSKNTITGSLDAKLATSPFPDNLDVEIHKHGNGPAEIEIKRGDQAWKIKETELDQLPPELRPHVMSLLGRGPRFMVAVPPPGIHARGFAKAAGPTITVAPGAPTEVKTTTDVETEIKSPDRKPTKKSVERTVHVKVLRHLNSRAVSAQLDQMSHALDRLHHQVDELRHSLKENRSGPNVFDTEEVDDEEVVKEIKEKDDVEEIKSENDAKEVEKAVEEKKP